MAERQTQPELIRSVWIIIKKLNSEKKSTNLKNILLLVSNEKKLTAEYLEKELTKAIDEELIVNSNQASSIVRILYQIPELDEAERNRLETCSDWYCYFCHTGEHVVQCARCPRVMHTVCANRDADESRDEEDTLEIQPDLDTILINNSNPESSELAGTSRDSSMNVCVDDSWQWLPFVVLKKEPLKMEETELDESKPAITDDCQFVSVVRQPAKRKTQDVKNNIILIRNDSSDLDENPLEESVEFELNSNEIICQRCELLGKSDKNQSPNISVSDLNCLLGFLYERIKPWINFAATALSKSFSKELQETFKLLFLKFPVTLESIKLKLSSNTYTTLDEFYCDILDFHHCVAIIYGTKSKEFHTSQQTKIECAYHISEIRACHDCYRHSNQLQKKSPLWFTAPCTIRHELVFAKQVGFPYWPAKVLKVLDDDYDVRFFGPKHTRAIVNAKCIRPIDTSLEELKISKKSTGFVKAIEELELYQHRRLNNLYEDYSNVLSNSFQLNGTPISNYNASWIADTSLNNVTNISPAPKINGTPRPVRPRSNLRIRNKIIKGSQNNNLSTNGQTLQIARSPPLLVSENSDNHIKSINVDKNSKVTLDNIKTALNAIPMGIEPRKQILRSVELEVENLTTEFKNVLKQVKKGDWCYVCGKYGKFYCCYSIFYCSIECQHKNWKEEHANNCRRVIDVGESI